MMVSGVGLVMMVGLAVVGAQHVTEIAAGAFRWTDVISHGELLRSGYDEKLEVDPADLRFLFQGVLDKDRQDKSYGEIPWKLGLLEPAE